MFALRKSVLRVATSRITGAASSSSVEAPEHLTTSVVTELSTFPPAEPSTFSPGDVSASEDKMPKDLPMLTTSSGAALPMATKYEALTQTMELEKKYNDDMVSIRINVFQETVSVLPSTYIADFSWCMLDFC